MKNIVTNNNALVLVLALVSLGVLVSLGSAQSTGAPCELGSTLTQCGVVVGSDGGFGAVELCETCFACGMDDGVCPELYSDGDFVDRFVVMKVPDVGHAGDNFTYNYFTGEGACGAIGGDCVSIQSSLNQSSWSSAGIACSQDLRGADLNSYSYYRADCSAPRTGGCANCPDPDCYTSLKGVAYNVETGELMSGVNIRVHALSNPLVDSSADTGGTGMYDSSVDAGFSPVTGNLRVTCTYPQFFPHVEDVYLQHDRNIFHCRMKRADCSPSCTLPDDQGNEVCSAICVESDECKYPGNVSYNGVDYTPEQVADMCDGLSPDTFIPLGPNAANDSYIDGVLCCNKGLVSRYMPEFHLEGEGIRNLVTRNFRKEIDGVPVTLKVIVYNR